jgi:hypothetical protein
MNGENNTKLLKDKSRDFLIKNIALGDKKVSKV